MSVVTILIHLGTDEQGRARKAALERIANEHGLHWNDQPSIGRLVTAIADGEIKLIRGTLPKKA